MQIAEHGGWANSKRVCWGFSFSFLFFWKNNKTFQDEVGKDQEVKVSWSERMEMPRPPIRWHALDWGCFLFFQIWGCQRWLWFCPWIDSASPLSRKELLKLQGTRHYGRPTATEARAPQGQRRLLCRETEGPAPRWQVLLLTFPCHSLKPDWWEGVVSGAPLWAEPCSRDFPGCLCTLLSEPRAPGREDLRWYSNCIQIWVWTCAAASGVSHVSIFLREPNQILKLSVWVLVFRPVELHGSLTATQP